MCAPNERQTQWWSAEIGGAYTGLLAVVILLVNERIPPSTSVVSRRDKRGDSTCVGMVAGTVSCSQSIFCTMSLDRLSATILQSCFLHPLFSYSHLRFLPGSCSLLREPPKLFTSSFQSLLVCRPCRRQCTIVDLGRESTMQNREPHWKPTCSVCEEHNAQ